MARLLEWPLGLPVVGREPMSGPRTVGAGSSQTIGGFVQTVAAPFGLWRWRFSMKPMRGQVARRYRGWVTALHGGANATRVPFCDWDGLTPRQAGMDANSYGQQLWGNGLPWSNGQGWQSTPPTVPVAAPAARGDTIITLADEHWGHRLGIGDLIGFFPLHFGLYMVTEEAGAGKYRIWPPLRKAITADDFATLRPTLAMRLESEEAATAPRDAAFVTGASVTLVETLDYDVRDYFAD